MTELDYLTIVHRHFVAYLAERYAKGEFVAIAGLCDEMLDRSGRLLGEVREVAGADPLSLKTAQGNQK